MTEPIQIESPQALINRARFAGKDFFTIFDDIISRLQANFVTAFNDFVSSETGVMLIDIVSWAVETLSFYIDRQAAESYLETAKLRRSVNRLARQLGYKMVPAVAASVDLSVNLTQVYAFDVPVPVAFQFKGPNDLIFEAAEQVIFPTGEGPTSPSRTITAREGYTVVERFRSSGEKNQAFVLNPGEGRYIAQGTAVGTVGGAPWTESEFISYDKTNQFEIDYNAEPPLLRFGDGVAGNIPTVGDDIVISYLSTSGKAGLVTSGTIEDVVTPLVVAFQQIGLTITNTSASSGGDDRETLEQTKRRVPFFFKARGVAVTREDYVGLAQAYSDPVAGTVAVAQAFVARGADDDLTLITLLNNIRTITAALETEVTGHTAAAEVARSSLVTLRDEAESANDDVGTSLASIASSSASARTSANGVRSEAAKARGGIVEINSFLSALPTATPSQLTAGDLATLTALTGNVDSAASSASGEADDVLSDLSSIDDDEAAATTSQGVVAARLTSMSADLATIQTELLAIDTAVSDNFEAGIETILVAIFDHVDGFLSDDCKANLVQVPIAAYDVNGFLVGPSTALIRSLQSYLTARKEVTQVVEVVSGEPFLVPADIDIIVGTLAGYVQASVLSVVRETVDDILRDRAFGEKLWLSEIHTALSPDPVKGTGGVEGVDYVVVTITGPAANLDAKGNLNASDSEVITKGTVTITGEVSTS